MPKQCKPSRLQVAEAWSGGRMKHLKGEEKLRHATLKEFRDA